MSQIFELFGYPVDTWDEEAWKNLRVAHCPFIGGECDGGGNRYASKVSLRGDRELRRFFAPELDTVQAGVCSLQLREGEQPWIVCPKRLLHCSEAAQNIQKATQESVLAYTGLKKGERYKVWTEIKLKTEVTGTDGRNVLFDYSFDYILSTVVSKPLREVCDMTGKTERSLKTALTENGMTIARRGNSDWIEDFPDGTLVLIEIMTSSTSGGNDAKRTQIGQVFKETILRLAGVPEVAPNGPGINYRQVWARMISQLLVKSQIGTAWGGKTFWVLQDVLADYISRTTALDVSAFLSIVPDEVNIISFGYGRRVSPDKRGNDGRLIPMKDGKLYAGPIDGGGGGKGFVDIVKLGCSPGVDKLKSRLLSKKPCYSGVV